MRSLNLIAVLPLLAGLPGCDGPPSTSPTEADLEAERYDPLGEQLENLEQLLAEVDLAPGNVAPLDMLELPFDALELRDPPTTAPLPDDLRNYLDQPELPRNWMNCDGYITNNASEGFCEDSPPSDWRGFMFNGQRFFVVPLGPSA